jgi:hypothetical protein
MISLKISKEQQIFDSFELIANFNKPTKSQEGKIMKPDPSKKKMRASDELEVIKLILDEDKDLKKRVMRFIQKSLGKTTSVTAKAKKGETP